MKFAVALLMFALAPACASAADGDLGAASNSALIDSLVNIGGETPGAEQTASSTSFMANDVPPRFAGGILGSAQPTVPPQMRELVRRGLTALPALLAHLNDARSTKLVVGDPFFSYQGYEGEYDLGPGSSPRTLCNNENCIGKAHILRQLEKLYFRGKYTVKVGDVCYVLIGQIVDRWFNAVRYQPSGNLYINSPVKMPWLAKRTREDWRGLTADRHKSSLIADLHNASGATEAGRALERLRFYYPHTYAALSGEDAVKRIAFEADEKKQ